MVDVSVVVTEAMIEAGASAMFRMLGPSEGDGHSYDEVAVEVFRIMLAHCPSASGISAPDIVALDTNVKK